MTSPAPKVELTDDEWRKKLTSDRVRGAATGRYRATGHR